MSWIIPVNRLRETDTLMAFYHPSPTYSVHILIVPKRSLRGMESLTENDMDFMAEVFATVQYLIETLDLPAYRLICNGGDYQGTTLVTNIICL